MVKKENIYIDSISYILVESPNILNEIRSISKKEIEEVVDLIKKDKILRIEAEKKVDDMGITIFIEKSLAHIGIVDMYNDINYYYNNLSESKELISIAGQVFEKWMVCYEKEILIEIILTFFKTGEKLSKVEWYEE